MSTFDAGKIQGTADIDKVPFSTKLREMRAEADAFERRGIHVKADVDSAGVRRGLSDIDQQVSQTQRKVRMAADDSAKSMNPLLTAALLLGPALIPVGGAALAMGAGFIGAGAAGVAAFKGIQVEIKNNTALGKQYNTQLGIIKQSLVGIEHSTAAATLTGVAQATGKISAATGQLRPELASLAGQTADIAQHLVGGLVGGFTTFAPLMHMVLDDADKAASRFESWATGPGGEKFARTLAADYQLALPALGQLIRLVGTLSSAFAPVGGVILTDLGLLARVLNSMPIGAAQALATAFIAWKVASVAALAIERASIALKGLAVAEGEAAAAGGARGLAGSLGAGVAALGPYVAGATAFVIAARAAADATKDWATSTDSAKRVVHGALDILSLNFGAVSKDVQGANQASNVKSAQALVDAANQKSLVNREAYWSKLIAVDQTNIHKYEQLQGQYRNDLATAQPGSAAFKDAQNRANATIGPLSNAKSALVTDQGGYDAAAAGLKRVTDATAEYIATVNKANAADLSQTANFVARQTSLSTAASAYDALAKSAQTGVDAEKLFAPVAKDQGVTVQGVTYSLKAFNAAMAQGGGDVNKAAGYLAGHTAALKLDQAAVIQAQQDSARLSAAQGAVQQQYKLTSDQVDAYTGVLGINLQDVATGAVTTQTFSDAIGRVAAALSNGQAYLDAYTAAVNAFTGSADTAASRGALMSAVLKAANGDALGYAGVMSQAAAANAQVVSSFTSAAKATVDWKTGAIDFRNAAAAPLISALQQLQTAAGNSAAATYQHELSIKGATQASNDAYDIYVSQTKGALIDEASQLGLTSTQAGVLADKYFGIKNSGDIKKQIALIGQDKVNTALQGILADLDILAGKHPKPSIDINANPALYQISLVKNALNHLPQSVNTTINAHSDQAQTGAYGMLIERYAQGGMHENHNPYIYKSKPGVVRVFAEPDVGDEAYIPLRNDGRRPRAKAIATEAVRRMGGTVQFDSGGIFGFTGVAKSPNVTGSGSSSSSKARISAISSLITGVQGELSSLGSLSKATASVVQTAINKILASFTKSVPYHAANNSMIAHIKTENAALLAEVNARAALVTKLGKDQAAYNTIHQNWIAEAGKVEGAVTQGFNAQSGNGYSYGIKATLDQQLADANKFIKLRAQAKALGLSPALLQMYTEAGPAQGGAALEAIVGAGKDYVSGLNTEYGQLLTAANTIGQGQATDIYGKQQADALAVIAADNKGIAADTKKVAADLAAIKTGLSTLEHNLTVAKRQN